MNEIKFRVYPESVYGFYFDCVVYSDQSGFRVACKAHNGTDPGDDCRGIVLSSRTIRNGRFTKRLGRISLVQGNLDAEVLSHESVHAALRWAEAMKLNITEQGADEKNMASDCGEERFAYAVGRICAQMSDAMWEHGLVEATEMEKEQSNG